MKLITIYILIALTALKINASELTDSADRAYDVADYSTAAKLYKQALVTDGSSSDLYYNLGNAEYRLGNTAQAILAYERALRLNPGNTDAKSNLTFVNQRIMDKKGETGSFLSNTYDNIVGLMSSNNWAWLAVTLSLLTVAAFVLYAVDSHVVLRKIGFFGGIATGLLCIISVILAFAARSQAEDTTYAIITAESTTLSTAPRTPQNHQEEAMLLHEGTKVKILRTIGLEADTATQTWHEVQVDNKHRAWINGADIEPII